MMLGRDIRVTHNPDPNVPFDWFVKSAGQNISRHDIKSAAVTAAEKKANNSRGQIELIVETMDGGVTRRKTYEGTEGMPSLDDIGIM